MSSLMSSPTSRRFFHRLWRFNAVAIAAVALMALGFGLLAGIHLVRDLMQTRHVASIAPVMSAAGSPQDSGRRQLQLEAQGFSRLPRHDVMWAALTSTDHMVAGTYSKEAVNTRDYVFYEMATGKFWRLTGRVDSLIPQISFLSRPAGEPSTALAQPPVAPADNTVALVLTMVDKDSNGDGRLSGQDLKSVAIAGPTGLGLTTIARETKALIGHAIAADGSAIVLIRDKDDVTRALKVSLADFSVGREDAFVAGVSARE